MATTTLEKQIKIAEKSDAEVQIYARQNQDLVPFKGKSPFGLGYLNYIANKFDAKAHTAATRNLESGPKDAGDIFELYHRNPLASTSIAGETKHDEDIRLLMCKREFAAALREAAKAVSDETHGEFSALRKVAHELYFVNLGYHKRTAFVSCGLIDLYSDLGEAMNSLPLGHPIRNDMKVLVDQLRHKFGTSSEDLAKSVSHLFFTTHAVIIGKVLETAAKAAKILAEKIGYDKVAKPHIRRLLSKTARRILKGYACTKSELELILTDSVDVFCRLRKLDSEIGDVLTWAVLGEFDGYVRSHLN